MKIQTTRFGELNIPEDRVIEIPDGVLGLPDSTSYILLEHDSEGTPFNWLQAVDNPDLAFIVMDPHLVVDGYTVQFDDDAVERFGTEKADDSFGMLAIVNVPREDPVKMTVNLRAPIVVQLQKRLGQQVVLPDDYYPIRHLLFPEAGDKEKAGKK